MNWPIFQPVQMQAHLVVLKQVMIVRAPLCPSNWEGTPQLSLVVTFIARTTPAGQPWSIAMTKRASAACRSALSALHWPKSSSTMVPSSWRAPHKISAAAGGPSCMACMRPADRSPPMTESTGTAIQLHAGQSPAASWCRPPAEHHTAPQQRLQESSCKTFQYQQPGCVNSTD